MIKAFRAQSGSQTAFAKSQGISSKTFAGWIVSDFKSHPASEQAHLSRICELEKEVRELRWERDVLKKATVIFAKESR